MKSRPVLLAAVVGLAVTLLAPLPPGGQGLLVLEWASKGDRRVPPVAVLIELGRKDTQATSWAGKATVTGATVVHREGYAFQKDDRLTDPDGWQASSLQGGRGGEEEEGGPGRGGGGQLGRRGAAPGRREAGRHPDRDRRPGTRAGRGAARRGAGRQGPAPVGRGGRGPARLDGDAGGDRRRPRTTSPPPPTAPTARSGSRTSATPSRRRSGASRRPSSRGSRPTSSRTSPRVRRPAEGRRLPRRQVGQADRRDGRPAGPRRVRHRGRGGRRRCGRSTAPTGTADARAARPADHRRRRPGSSGRRRRSPRRPGRHVHPVACTDQSGAVRVVCQTWEAGRQDRALVVDRAGGGVEARPAIAGPGRAWHAGPVGRPERGGRRRRRLLPRRRLRRAADDRRRRQAGRGWRSRRRPGSRPGRRSPTTRGAASGSPTRRARRSGARTTAPRRRGRQPALLRPHRPRRLRAGRQAAAARPPSCRRWASATRSPIATGDQSSGRPRYAHPQSASTARAGVWLTYRQKFGSRYTHPPRLLLAHLRPPARRRHAGPSRSRSTTPTACSTTAPCCCRTRPAGCSSSTTPTAATPRPETIDNPIYMSYVDLPGDPAEPKLVPHDPGAKKDDEVGGTRRRPSGRRSSGSAATASRRAARSTGCSAASSTATPRSPGTAAPTARSRTCSATASTPPRWTGSATATTTTAAAASTPGG